MKKKRSRRPGKGARGRVPAASRMCRSVGSHATDSDLLDAAFETSASPLALLGVNPLRVLRANRAFRALLPEGAEDPAGADISTVWPLAAIEPALRRAAETGQPARLPHHAIATPHGEQRRFAVHVNGAGTGERRGLLVALWDTTELEMARRQAEEAAERALRHAAELDAVLDSMADGLVLYGPLGEILRMNEAAARLLPIPQSDWARPFSERDRRPSFGADGHQIPMADLPAARALVGSTVRGARMRIIHPERGSIWVAVSAAPIRGPGGIVGGAVMTISDESDVHALEQERDDLLRMISHDLRTPLNAVATAAHLIRRNPGDAAKVEERATAIARSCDRMRAMIEELVETTLLEAGQLRLNISAVDLAVALPELVERLRGGLAAERIRLDVAPALPRVLADPAHLERILVNLLSNALKYSPPESEVVLEAALAPRGVAIAVTDRGVGIAPEDQPHIFDRFFRARGARRPEGLGLGLYIARLLVEAHGGTVSAESRLGQGSTFRVTFPAAP